jgi:hypothetical protein
VIRALFSSVGPAADLVVDADLMVAPFVSTRHLIARAPVLEVEVSKAVEATMLKTACKAATRVVAAVVVSTVRFTLIAGC